MAKQYSAGVSVPTGFKLLDGQPIADYMVVQTLNDLTDETQLPYQFVGMFTFVLGEDKMYQKTSTGWEPIGVVPETPTLQEVVDAGHIADKGRFSSTGFTQGSTTGNNIYAPTIVEDGNILIAIGADEYNGEAVSGFVKLDKNGNRLPFNLVLGDGGNGFVNYPDNITLLSDGYLMVQGYSSGEFYVGSATTPTWIVKTDFDGNITKTYPFAYGEDENVAIYSAVIDDNGNTYITGAFELYNGQPVPSQGTGFVTRIIKILANGTLDLTFNNGLGYIVTITPEPENYTLYPYSIQIVGDKLYAFGGGNESYIPKYNLDGTLDELIPFNNGDGFNTIYYTQVYGTNIYFPINTFPGGYKLFNLNTTTDEVTSFNIANTESFYSNTFQRYGDNYYFVVNGGTGATAINKYSLTGVLDENFVIPVLVDGFNNFGNRLNIANDEILVVQSYSKLKKFDLDGQLIVGGSLEYRQGRTFINDWVPNPDAKSAPLNIFGRVNIEDDFNNVFIGTGTGQDNTTGNTNTAVGTYAMWKNTTGSYNTAYGNNALSDNTIGSQNTAVGSYALWKNTGSFNTAVGSGALETNVSGISNNAIGNLSLFKNISGSYNTAMGEVALYQNVSGSSNVAIGDSSLFNTLASDNTAVGDGAGLSNTTGTRNVYMGGLAARFGSTGSRNIGIGQRSLYNNIAGNDNTALGNAALYNSSGSSNIWIGSTVLNSNTVNPMSGSNSTIIGTNLTLTTAERTLSNQIILADGSNNRLITRYGAVAPVTIYGGIVIAASATTAAITSGDAKTLTTKEWVQSALSGVTSGITSNTGLQAINEGNGTAWRLIGMNAANYGNIGQGAVDHSTQGLASTTAGATGQYSVAGGFGTTAGSPYAVSFGFNNISSGMGSVTFGYSSKARGFGELSIGSHGTDYTALGTGADRVFNVGNGDNAGAESDALSVYRSGLMRLPSVTNALINSADGKAVVTKEYLTSFTGGTIPSFAQVMSAGTYPGWSTGQVSLTSYPVGGDVPAGTISSEGVFNSGQIRLIYNDPASSTLDRQELSLTAGNIGLQKWNNGSIIGGFNLVPHPTRPFVSNLYGPSTGTILATEEYVTAALSGSTGGGTWGSITGSLSAQTDLQTVLNGKFNNPTGNTTQYLLGNGVPRDLGGDVRNVSLLGFTTVPNSTPITSGDTILGAFGRVQGQLDGKFAIPTGTTAQYVTGNGTLASFNTSVRAVDILTANPSGTTQVAVGTTFTNALWSLQNQVNTKFTTPTGTTAQYVTGNGTLASFNQGVLNAAISGLTFTNSSVNNGDSVLTAIGKLQQQHDTMSGEVIREGGDTQVPVSAIAVRTTTPTTPNAETLYFIENDTINYEGSVTIPASGTVNITIPHSLGVVPTYVNIQPKNQSAAGILYYDADNTNIKVVYTTAPTGTLDFWVKYSN